MYATDEIIRLLRSPAGRGVAARVVWGGLLAMHGPAVVSASAALLAEPTVTGVLRFLGLLLTIAFFAYKACGGRILPTRTRPWIATAAFLALTGLAHAGLMPAKAGDVLVESAPAALVLATAGAAVANRRRLIKRLDDLTDALGRWLARFLRASDRAVLAFLGLVQPDPQAAPVQCPRSGPTPTRGPPMLGAR